VGVASGARVFAADPFDVVIRRATVYDGTGGPGFVADVGISGDRIAAIGDIAAEQAKRAVEGSNLSLAPGFVDIHTHSDGDILEYPGAESRILQGVTTEVTGNCGSSAAPRVGRPDGSASDGGAGEPGWTDHSSYCARVERARIALNHAPLVGQGTLRRNVAGLVHRPLSRDEISSVLGSLEEALDQGAFGLSTGLEYTPGRFTPPEEIVEMARLVARRGGLYASHIRNEEDALLEAVNEAIHVGRSSGARVQISHLKAAGKVNWAKQVAALDLIEGARRHGVEVLADAYPYVAYSTGITIQLPDWALEGGIASTKARLADPGQRTRIRDYVRGHVMAEPGGFDLIVISSVKTEAAQPLVGRDLKSIAETMSSTTDPAELLLRLVETEDGDVGFIGYGMSEENVEAVLRHPLVMVASDGRAMSPSGRAARTRPHPRSYGCFARVLGRYVRERKAMDLPTAIRKMTSMPASQAGLSERGRIARGMKADLVLFDAARVSDGATFETPHRYATGVAAVFVNGVQVAENGRPTGARPGRVLRRG
jgi:N-acyl-D-amino-acid deacylase